MESEKKTILQYNYERTKILSSQYKGVSWHSKTREWYAQLQVKGKKKYGGTFKDELDAAKRVNQLCEELGIPFQNPTISAKPNKKKEVTCCEKIGTVKIHFSNFFSNVFFLNPGTDSSMFRIKHSYIFSFSPKNNEPFVDANFRHISKLYNFGYH